ncbi:Ig-like domain-containing protein [Neobacillus bataviensis]|uniref:Ig-like domain-containing protein n=1 Tax=Neobacillus bataviensis TaxID=220685 RepID=UPI001CBF85E4|nr:Ig-like domain-containing protein [Neobacillus bataviensis]
MHLRRKSMVTRILAAVMAVMLVAYSIPVGVVTSPVLAQNEQDVFTLKIVKDGADVPNQVVTGHNTDNSVSLEGTTDNKGIVQFPELTNVSSGEIQFTVGEDTFPITFNEVMAKHYTYDTALNRLTVTPDQKTHDVIVKTTGSGKVEINNTEYSAPVQVAEGSNVNVKILPDPGNEIQSITVNEIKQNITDSFTIEGITEIKTIEVVFAAKLYPITVSYNKDLGTVENGDQTITDGQVVSAKYGEKPSFNVIPKTGYHIESITLNGEPVILPADVTQSTINYPLPLKPVTENVKVEVKFAINSYILTFDYEGNDDGKAQVDETYYSDGGTVKVDYGSKPVIKVIPKTGKHIESIKFGDEPIEIPKNVTDETVDFAFPAPEVTKDTTVKVVFAPNKYNVTVVDPDNGTVTSPNSVEYDGAITIAINPDRKYLVNSVKVNGTTYSTGIDLNDNGYYTYTVTHITKDTTIEVELSKMRVLPGTWDQYVSMTEPLSKHTVDNKEIRVYGNNAKVEIVPILDYNQIKLPVLGNGYKSGYIIDKNRNTTITDMYVRINNQFKSEAQVNVPGEIEVVFDTEKPVINDVILDGQGKKEVNGSYWFNGPVTISGSIDNGDSSYSSAIDKVYYSKDSEVTETEVPYDFEKNRFSITTADGDYKGVYKIWTVDKAGNKSDIKTVNINIDKTKPTLADGRSVKVEKLYDFIPDFFIRIGLGMFFNNGIKVTVKAVDDAAGISDISLNAVSKNAAKQAVPRKFFYPDQNPAKAVFVLDDESFEGTFSVDVTDNVGNTQTFDVTKDNIEPEGDPVFMIDRKKPSADITVLHGKEEEPYVVKDEETGRETEFYSEDVKLDVKAKDQESGVNTVTIDLNDEEYKKYDFSDSVVKQINPAIDQIDTQTLADKGPSYDFNVVVKDNAGNDNKADQVKKKIYIDQKAPTLADGKDAVTFDFVNDSTIAKVLNFLSFGTFFNKQIKVTVKVKDEASGIKDFALHAVPADASAEKVVPQLDPDSYQNDGKTAQATYILDVDSFKGTFNVAVTDNVNNKSVEPYLVTAANSNIEAKDSGIVMIEKNKPTTDIAVIPQKDVASYVDKSKTEFYSGEATYDVDVQDADAGVNAVQIKVNDKLIDEYDYHDKETAQLHPDLTATDTNDERISREEDGSYHIYSEVVDNAGNVNTADRTIYIDETAPTITDFAFSSKDKNENATETLQPEAVETTKYGFYFKQPVQVTVTANDPNTDHDYQATSGLQSMVVYLKDYENGKMYAVIPDSLNNPLNDPEHAKGKLSETKDISTVEGIPTTSQLTFTVPASFKGQIFAEAFDNVNNTSGVVKPDGSVIEDAAKHGKEEHIDFNRAKTTLKDTNNADLYNKNVDVNLTVTDTYSGIGEIEWWVEAPYDQENNQHGRLQINNDKSYTDGSNIEGWKHTEFDQNLVQEMTKTITVKNDSNDINVKVKMTDRAGNTTEKKITFSIDKTAPTIDVTYDNNTDDPQNADYFKADRTATIVVNERNFKAADVVHKITNTDGVIPKLVGWKTVANTKDPNKTTHTATVKYSADGDYTFDIKYKDNAGNAAAPFAQQKFTLDKTIPVIKVSYNNNAAANGNYYKAARTATISITEHNFETSRIKVTGNASDGGKPAAFPRVSGWSNHGDVHTATISYAADGKYSFDIEYTDMAGNIAADYPKDEFIIDQTVPKLTITGVEDMSANNKDVAPVITYSDTNFNKKAVSISLKGANRGTAKLAGSYTDAANGQVFKYKNFEKKKENDDLYTLTATLTDFAGNVSTKTIRFSVNRFGSVYVFDDSLKAIEGKYVKNEQDVILTETNVDSLKQDTIKMKVTKNGTPSDLVKGSDYTVTETGGKGKWSQYTYVVKKKLFSGDGRYTVALYSEDAAGNINENIDEAKKAEISFGIDKTAPVVVPVNIESGKQYPVEEKAVTVSIKDNLVLNGAEFYVNDQKVENKADGENYTFAIKNSNDKQNVKIVAVDAAGNELTKEVNDLLVSTNPIVRWYNNKPLFAGSLGGVGSLAIAATSFFLFRKKKKFEDDHEEAAS